MSVLAFNLTSDKPKPVALIGWDKDKINLQQHSEHPELKDMEDAWLETFASELADDLPSWLRVFNPNNQKDIEEIVKFLTKGIDSRQEESG